MITFEEWNEKAKSGKKAYVAAFGSVEAFKVDTAYYGISAYEIDYSTWRKPKVRKPMIIICSYKKGLPPFLAFSPEFCYFSKDEAEFAAKQQRIKWKSDALCDAKFKMLRAQEEYEQELKK